jgi:SEC-C motif-containing protein
VSPDAVGRASLTAADRCPCGTGEPYGECCGRFHSGAAAAPTAPALMRSRFSAFAVGDAAYLLRTWHPSTRPAQVDLDHELRWTRLEIVQVVAGGPFDSVGTVEFTAHFRSSAAGQPGQPGQQGQPRTAALHERSSFVRERGEWFYVRGD